MIALFPIRDLLRFLGSALCRAPLAASARKALPGARGGGETGGSSFRRRRKVFHGPCARRGLAGAWRPTGLRGAGRKEGSGSGDAMFRRAKRLDEGWNAVVTSSGHAEFVYADVSYFSRERKVPYLRLRECYEDRFACHSFAEDGAHRAMLPFGGWEKEYLLRNLPASGAAHPWASEAFSAGCLSVASRRVSSIRRAGLLGSRILRRSPVRVE